MSLCDKCKLKELKLKACGSAKENNCGDFVPKDVPGPVILFNAMNETPAANDPVNAPNHYIGKIECIDYLRDKLTPEEFTGFCMGNVLKYCSRWRKKDGVQDLKKASVYLNWAIEANSKE